MGDEGELIQLLSRNFGLGEIIILFPPCEVQPEKLKSTPSSAEEVRKKWRFVASALYVAFISISTVYFAKITDI